MLFVVFPQNHTKLASVSELSQASCSKNSNQLGILVKESIYQTFEPSNHISKEALKVQFQSSSNH